jgi:hypothetical protein
MFANAPLCSRKICKGKGGGEARGGKRPGLEEYKNW